MRKCKCPNCGSIELKHDVDGYIIKCAECGYTEIEDEFDLVET